MKKKFLLLIMMILVIVGLTGCGQKEEDILDDNLSGGWSINSDIKTLTMSKEAKEVFDEASTILASNAEGVNYELVALLGTQVVNGTNYLYLTKGTLVTKKQEQLYKVVIVNKSSDGSVSLVTISDFDYEEYTQISKSVDYSKVSGGWSVYSDTGLLELDSKMKNIFDKGLDTYVGYELKPMVYLGSQVVSGTNYAILCLEGRDNEDGIGVVTFYEDLNGKISITNVYDVDLKEFNK